MGSRKSLGSRFNSARTRFRFSAWSRPTARACWVMPRPTVSAGWCWPESRISPRSPFFAGRRLSDRDGSLPTSHAGIRCDSTERWPTIETARSMKPRILYTKPSITELEVRYSTDAAANGWGDHCYDYIHRFEAAFKDHLGSAFAIATSSCTGALHLGMAALGIGAGDEVIMADSNWIASAAPIVHLG